AMPPARKKMSSCPALRYTRAEKSRVPASRRASAPRAAARRRRPAAGLSASGMGLRSWAGAAGDDGSCPAGSAEAGAAFGLLDIDVGHGHVAGARWRRPRGLGRRGGGLPRRPRAGGAELLAGVLHAAPQLGPRPEEHTSELQSR